MEKSKCCEAKRGKGFVSLSENTSVTCSSCGKPFESLLTNSLMTQTDEEMKKEFEDALKIEWLMNSCDCGNTKIDKDKITNFWLSKFHTLQEEYKGKILEEFKKELSYILYNLKNSIKHEREGTNIYEYKNDVDKYMELLGNIIKQ